jgi:hypothetical protein
MKPTHDDSDVSVGAGLQALRNQLETLGRATSGTPTKPDLPPADNLSARSDALAHGSYEMWLKSEPRIPLKAYWVAFCLLCFVSYSGPPFLRAVWAVGLAWVLGEWQSRKHQQQAYGHGVEFGISVAASRGARRAENLQTDAGAVATESADYTGTGREAGERDEMFRTSHSRIVPY